MCFAYFSILFCEKPSSVYALAVGACLGLALLTKGTAYIFACPLLMSFTAISFKTIKLSVCKYLIIMLFLALIINSGHCIRNYNVFGNIISSGTTNYSNVYFNGSVLLSNVTRNLALEMTSQSTFFNDLIQSGTVSLHSLAGMDVCDVMTTWPGTTFKLNPARHEDVAGNPAHLLLILFAVVAILIRRKFRERQNVIAYSCALIAAFLLFCLYLKWQPWHSRLLLPLIILWSPIIGYILSRLELPWIARSSIITIFVLSVPFVLFNEMRPLVSIDKNKSIFLTDRNSQYFNSKQIDYECYMNAVSKINNMNCSDLGIRTGDDAWEYPLWVFMEEHSSQKVHIEHIDVKNESGKIPLINPNFCKIFTIPGSTTDVAN